MNGASGVLIDGAPSAAIAALDRGLAYGDGLFRTIRVEGGQPILWERHLAHLAEGCKRLAIPAPDPLVLAREGAALFADDGDGVLKIVVTRGMGGRGYRPPETPQPTRMLARFPLPLPPPLVGSGVRVRLCATRVAIQPATAGIKTLNRLDQVLARSEWKDEEIFEGLMMDTEGFVVGGTMSNLFLVIGGRLFTPAIDRAGIAGGMRGAVLDTAATLGIEAVAARLAPSALARADEAFLTNAVIGPTPVADLCGRALPTGMLAQRMRHAVLDRGRAPWPPRR